MSPVLRGGGLQCAGLVHWTGTGGGRSWSGLGRVGQIRDCPPYGPASLWEPFTSAPFQISPSPTSTKSQLQGCSVGGNGPRACCPGLQVKPMCNAWLSSPQDTASARSVPISARLWGTAHSREGCQAGDRSQRGLTVEREGGGVRGGEAVKTVPLNPAQLLVIEMSCPTPTEPSTEAQRGEAVLAGC